MLKPLKTLTLGTMLAASTLAQAEPALKLGTTAAFAPSTLR